MPKPGSLLAVLAILVAVAGFSPRRNEAADSLLEPGWKHNGLAVPRFAIQGTGDRNNPLRRALRSSYAGDELFIRFRLRYDAKTIDTPAKGDGEFFVFWLDAVEGNDASTHSSEIPNLGIHVAGDENRFMARYGPSSQKFGPPLAGDRAYLIVGRLWKSAPGEQSPFDQLDLWVDPQAGGEFTPQASTSSRQAIRQVRWIGFSTGRKTELNDRIEVWDIDAATNWQAILNLPTKLDAPSVDVAPEPRRTVDFTDDVYPILKSRCFECHAGSEAEEGVRLDIHDEVLNRISPRNAKQSRLFELVAEGEMPPEGEQLNKQQLAVLQAWIDEGLAWDERLLPTPAPQSDHWAFQPIRRPAIPDVANGAWLRTPIDAFIAQRHEQLGLTPAPGANVAILQRRLALDLLGLPPTNLYDGPSRPSKEAKGNDAKQAAGSARLVSTDIDDLLSSPAHGERWARHWLDVARWAESNGHQHNRNRPHAWRYRDWVVDAFTNDKPFNDFLRAQIAGDEIAPYRDENIVATGFLSAARYSGNELDKDIQRNDLLVDIVNTTGKAFLGLTLECAQCHTHKFDPLSIRDYYRFQAFFAKGQPGNVVLGPHEGASAEIVAERWRIFDTVEDRMVSVRRKRGYPEPIYITPTSVVGGMNAKERARFNELDKQIAALPQSWSFYSPATAGQQLPVAPHEMRWPLPRDPTLLAHRRTMLLIRGDVKSLGPEVQPGWPAVFGATPADLQHPRTALADWMTRSENPLTARVWVNRIWQWHFGRGLVETSGDFGTQGAKPTHAELLDYLAAELIDSGWSTRHVHRLIVDSATYRQSSRYSPENAALDPANKLLWRWTPRRLEAEAIRDSVLAVSGQMDMTRGGESVDDQSMRRSLYLKQRRDNLPHQQMLFDSATGIASCSRRRVSTTGLQPLWLMNSKFMQQAAEKFADRAGSVEKALQLAYGRKPKAQETQHLKTLAAEFGLKSACLAILNSSEFLYIP